MESLQSSDAMFFNLFKETSIKTTPVTTIRPETRTSLPFIASLNKNNEHTSGIRAEIILTIFIFFDYFYLFKPCTIAGRARAMIVSGLQDLGTKDVSYRVIPGLAGPLTGRALN